MMKTDGSPDATIRRLRDDGLEIAGSLRLSESANYWSLRHVPSFLRVGSDTEMYERLASLNTATYSTMGFALRNLEDIKRLFGRPRQVKKIRRADTRDAAGLALSGAFFADQPEREAAFYAFVTNVSGALDSFSGEAALLLNLPFSIWYAKFTKLCDVLREPDAETLGEVGARMSRELAHVVLRRYVDMEGCTADWHPQLQQYRHAAVHRPHSLWCGEFRRIDGTLFKLDSYLVLDTFSKPSDVLPYSWLGAVSDERAQDIIHRFQQQPVEEYCCWVFEHVRNLLSDAYVALVAAFEERSESPTLLRNDPAVLLRRGPHQARTRFTGIR
jgi:hypothetical protein